MPSYVKKILSFFEKSNLGYYFQINKKIYMYRKDLALVLGVSTQSIKNYEAKGLEALEEAPTRTPMYDLHYALDWYKSNVNTKFKPNSLPPSTTTTDMKPSEHLDDYLSTLPMYKREIFYLSDLDDLDKLVKLRDIEKKEIDNKIKLGELIDANDVDKSMTALSAMFLGSFINFEKVSGSVLANKKEHEIPKLIRDAHDGVWQELDSLVRKDFSCDETLYDVIGVVMEKLNNGLTPIEIIDKLVG